MSGSSYQINKGINKSIEFKGLKAQYIWYLAGGIIALLVLFAIMYIVGINSIICIGVALVAGTALVLKVFGMSNKYGEHGMIKAIARRSIPKVIRCNSRSVYKNEKKGKDE